MSPGARPCLALAFAVGCVLVARPAAAQYYDACAARLPLVPTDTVHRIVRLTLGSRAPEPGTPVRGWAESVMDAVSQHFRAPAPLSVPELARRRFHPESKDSTSMPGLRGLFLITVARDGTLEGATEVASTGSPELDEAVLRAARAADSARSFVPLPDSYMSPRATVALYVTTGEARKDEADIPLFRIGLAYTRAPRPIRPADKVSGRGPSYPDKARAQKITGDVVLRFVVDTAGRVWMSTVRPLWATDSTFTNAVLTVLPTWRFLPASDDGCPVEETVGMPFEFRLGRR